MNLERLTIHQKVRCLQTVRTWRRGAVDNEQVYTCVLKDHCTVHMFELIETVRFDTLNFQNALSKEFAVVTIREMWGLQSRSRTSRSRSRLLWQSLSLVSKFEPGLGLGGYGLDYITAAHLWWIMDVNCSVHVGLSLYLLTWIGDLRHKMFVSKHVPCTRRLTVQTSARFMHAYFGQ